MSRRRGFRAPNSHWFWIVATSAAAAACAPRPVSLLNANVVKRFSSALLADSGGRSPASVENFLPTAEDDSTWIHFTRGAAAESATGARDLSDYFEGGPLLVGRDTILEKKTRLVDGYGAVATCEGARRAIFYSPSWLDGVSADALAFVREHERAHHVLGHVTCSQPGATFKDPRTREDERGADCSSVGIWAAKGDTGIWVLSAAAERFFILNALQNDHYYSGRERAKYVRALCK